MSTTYKKNFIFLKLNSTLPEVKFPITQRIQEKYDITDKMMESVAVTFSMRNADDGIYKIANAPAKLVVVENQYEKLDETTYTLAYRFKSNQTAKAGRFEGEFVVDFIGNDYCGKIKFPLDSFINIVIGESSTKTSVI